MLVQLVFPGNLDKYDGHYEVGFNAFWNDFLKSVIGNDYYFLFDVDEQPKPFIAIYLNNKKLFNLNGLNCKNNDKLMILSATSGG